MATTFRGYVIRKRRDWRDSSTSGYVVMNHFFSNLGEAQDYIKSLTNVIKLGGE